MSSLAQLQARGAPDEGAVLIAKEEGPTVDLMLAQPSMIKRPVLEIDGKITLGFDAATYESLLNK